MTDTKMYVCFYLWHIVFVGTLDLDDDQITFYDQFMLKTSKGFRCAGFWGQIVKSLNI